MPTFSDFQTLLRKYSKDDSTTHSKTKLFICLSFPVLSFSTQTPNQAIKLHPLPAFLPSHSFAFSESKEPLRIPNTTPKAVGSHYSVIIILSLAFQSNTEVAAEISEGRWSRGIEIRKQFRPKCKSTNTTTSLDSCCPWTSQTEKSPNSRFLPQPTQNNPRNIRHIS